MPNAVEPFVYQLKVVLQGISPMIWRRILVKSDSTIADLHYTLQIVMGWTDSHEHIALSSMLRSTALLK